LLPILAGEQHDGGDEAHKCDQRERLGQACDQHEGGHDDGNGNDQPKGSPQSRRDLAARPHDGGADAVAEVRRKCPRASFCLIAQWLFSTTSTTRPASMIAPGLSRFCDTREDFRDIAMTDAAQWFRVFCRLLEDFRRRGGKVAGGGGSATQAYPV
jgi:hypothetical protein